MQPERDVRLLGVVGVQRELRHGLDPRPALARRDRQRGSAQPVPQSLAHQAKYLRVLDVPGHRQHHPRQRVAALVEAAQRRPGHPDDRLLGAEHRAAERVVAEDRADERLVQQVFRIVVAHRDLFEHDAALRVDVAVRALRLEHDVGD